ncbi:MAG TPA: transglutaminase domain-containing protein [Candidatus Deferrimicrobiaceae bacterium]|nr:transglutaminase domain-containing protein [Candidatus Deferrimicrobiaceae bacterium]
MTDDLLIDEHHDPLEVPRDPLGEPEGRLDRLIDRLPRHPAEGWLSLLAAALMAAAYGLAVDDAGWITDRTGDTSYLPTLALVGLAFGFTGARIGWGRWRTHLVGALFAGVTLPLVMGGALLSGSDLGFDPHALALRMAATVHIVELVWRDLVIEGRPVTAQVGHFHLVFGAMVWAAGQLVGYTVFGHRRPLDAVVVVGLLLLGNMVLTFRDQLGILVLFSAAALLLLVRSHIFDEQVTWTRRRIGDPRDMGTLYLKGGAAFVAVAMAGSLALTATASSAPLQNLWNDLPQRLAAMSEWFQRIAPAGGPFRNPGTISFGDTEAITGVWSPSDQVAFRAQFQPGEGGVTKWRARTYVTYTLYSFATGDRTDETYPPRATLLRGAADQANPAGRRPLSVQITPDAFRGAIISPQAPLSVDISSRAWTVGQDGWFAYIEPVGDAARYNVAAMVPVYGDAGSGITQARLRTAGTDYPPELEALYTELPPGAMGPAARSLLETIRERVAAPAGADPDNAFDLARTMEAYLRDGANFAYDTNVVDETAAQCGGVSSVECFAIVRRGFCQQYSSTMVVLLRESGIPARIATGFLAGEPDDTGLEVVNGTAAHWWVEVYFPGIGWVEFDPTGGDRGQPQAIPSGSIGPETPPPSLPPASAGPGPTIAPPSGGPNQGGAGSSVGPFIAIAAILAVGLAALAFAALRRTPRRPMHPDHAWAGLASWARRMGLGPRPSQTVYEYAGALGDEMPAARVELTTIARAKVEVAYGRRELGEEGLRGIAAAYQRLRLALLGFAIRRGFRRRRRR